MVEIHVFITQFPISGDSAEFHRVLSLYPQQPLGKPCWEPQHSYHLRMDSVVVRPQGDSGPFWWENLVPGLPIARPRGMDQPQDPSRCQVHSKAL